MSGWCLATCPPQVSLPLVSSCKSSVEIIHETFLTMRRVIFTHNGEPDAAAMRLRAHWQGRRQLVGSPGCWCLQEPLVRCFAPLLSSHSRSNQ